MHTKYPFHDSLMVWFKKSLLTFCRGDEKIYIYGLSSDIKLFTFDGRIQKRSGHKGSLIISMVILTEDKKW